MASEKEKAERENFVKIVGYLRENNLEKVTTDDGKEMIKGRLTIATDEFNTYKVSGFRVMSDSKAFDSLSKLLPDETLSIASYLKSHAGSAFAVAKEAATKVYITGVLSEYVSAGKDNKEYSRIEIYGKTGGVVKEKSDSDQVFSPCATFSTTVYINQLINESVEGKQTGRVIIEGLIPAYKDIVYKVPFVAPIDNNIARYISENYAQGNTVTLKGDLIRSRKRILIESEEKEEFFGRGAEDKYHTEFVYEQLICGGSAKPFEDGSDKKPITKQEVKTWLVNRDSRAQENAKRKSERAAQKKDAASTDTKETKTVCVEDFDDMDF